MPVRTVPGPTDRIVVVGAGLGGLACALHLAGAGREVTVVEREPVPGGRAGRRPPNPARRAAAGGSRRRPGRVARFSHAPPTRRVFSFQAMYAGLAPHDARALYAVIAYLDTVAGVYFPRGGIHAVPRALAGAAEKHGVRFRYGTTVSTLDVSGGRATGVITDDGERIPADVVVLNPDLPVAYRDLLRETPRRLRYSPSAGVLHIGCTQRYRGIAHHNMHFGQSWRGAVAEVFVHGRLVS